jgi:hypothetical protein
VKSFVKATQDFVPLAASQGISNVDLEDDYILVKRPKREAAQRNTAIAYAVSHSSVRSFKAPFLFLSRFEI